MESIGGVDGGFQTCFEKPVSTAVGLLLLMWYNPHTEDRNLDTMIAMIAGHRSAVSNWAFGEGR